MAQRSQASKNSGPQEDKRTIALLPRLQVLGESCCPFGKRCYPEGVIGLSLGFYPQVHVHAATRPVRAEDVRDGRFVLDLRSPSQNRSTAPFLLRSLIPELRRTGGANAFLKPTPGVETPG